MFSQTPAFSGFSVDHIDAARHFYGEVLGLSVTEQNGMLSLHVAGGGRVLVYPKGADHRPATFTILNFPVPDIDAAVSRLAAAGVELLRYDGVQHSANGVVRGEGWGPPIGWFTDPAGNVLAVLEEEDTPGPS